MRSGDVKLCKRNWQNSLEKKLAHEQLRVLMGQVAKPFGNGYS
jgi:hypothetical protein